MHYLDRPEVAKKRRNVIIKNNYNKGPIASYEGIRRAKSACQEKYTQKKKLSTCHRTSNLDKIQRSQD